MSLERHKTQTTVPYSSFSNPSKPVPAKSPPKPHRTRTSITITSSSSSSPSTSLGTIGNPSHGGALFILPREVRDEIYRLVVKRRYHTSHFLPVGTYVNDLAIFRVSRAIGHEATDIWLSESLFVFVIDFEDHVKRGVPSELLDRMKNVELQLELYDMYADLKGMEELDRIRDRDRYINTYRIAIAPFTTGHVAGNRLVVALISRELRMEGLILDEFLSGFLEALKAANRFRTVAVSICTLLRPSHDIIRAVKDKLEPVLGPSSEYLSAQMPAVEFHPQKYLVDSTK